MTQYDAGLVVHIPIEATKNLVTVSLDAVVAVRAHVIAVSVLQLAGNRLGEFYRHRCARLAGPVKLRLRAPGHLRIGEEEQLVLDDGAAQAETRLVVLIHRANLAVGAIHTAARHALVTAVAVHRARKFVSTAAGHGVHRATREVAQLHIKRGHLGLNFLNSVERNRVGAGRAAGQATGAARTAQRRRETNGVIVHGPVEGNVVVAEAGAGKRVVRVARVEARKVCDAARDGR